MNYKAITKTAVMPSRAKGMGKIMIEMMEIQLLTNSIVLRDWIIVEDEDGNEIHKEILKDYYVKKYEDTQLSIVFSSTEIELNSPTENYSRLKMIADEAVVIMNNFDPPYSLPEDSFEKYIDKSLIPPAPSAPSE